jgi:hypothetical protein
MAIGVGRRSREVSPVVQSPKALGVPRKALAHGDDYLRRDNQTSQQIARKGTDVPADRLSIGNLKNAARSPRSHVQHIEVPKLILPVSEVTIPPPLKFPPFSMGTTNSVTAVENLQTPPATLISPSPIERKQQVNIPGLSIPPLNNDWQYIQRLREETWTLRSKIHETRTILREKQQNKSIADDALFRRMVVTVLRHDTAEREILEKLMQDCQDARDSYGPLEDECNELEDTLSRREFKLARLESSSYENIHSPVLQNPSLGIPAHDILLSDHSSSGSEDNEIDELEYHPLVSKYLSRLGDLDLLRERLDDLIEEKENLLLEKASRQRFGRYLDPDDQEWLNNSQQHHDELVKEVREMELELQELKRDCLAQGLIDEEGEPTSFQTQEQSTFPKEQDIDPQNHQSEYVKYPLLLPKPGVKHEDIIATDPVPDQNSDLTTSRINTWILEKLRMSPLDVNLLASIFENAFGSIKEGWESAVLKFWYEDGTVSSLGASRAYTSEISTVIRPLPLPPSMLSSGSSQELNTDKDPGDGFLEPSIRPASDSTEAATRMRNMVLTPSKIPWIENR